MRPAVLNALAHIAQGAQCATTFRTRGAGRVGSSSRSVLKDLVRRRGFRALRRDLREARQETRRVAAHAFARGDLHDARRVTLVLDERVRARMRHLNARV